jgi:hypothetical protein
MNSTLDALSIRHALPAIFSCVAQLDCRVLERPTCRSYATRASQRGVLIPRCRRVPDPPARGIPLRRMHSSADGDQKDQLTRTKTTDRFRHAPNNDTRIGNPQR